MKDLPLVRVGTPRCARAFFGERFQAGDAEHLGLGQGHERGVQAVQSHLQAACSSTTENRIDKHFV